MHVEGYVCVCMRVFAGAYRGTWKVSCIFTLWMIKCSVYEAHMSPTLDRHLATCCFNGALNVAMCLKHVTSYIISTQDIG